MGGLGPCVSIVGWVGLGRVHKLTGWVGLGEEKWTHVHLWSGLQPRTMTVRVRRVGTQQQTQVASR